MKRIITICVLAFNLVTFADVVTLTNTDEPETTSFTSADRWDPQIAPNTDEGAVSDYVVANGLRLRTPQYEIDTGNAQDRHVVFGGRSLTLGDSTTGCELLTKVAAQKAYIHKASITINDLRFVNKASKIRHGGNRKRTTLKGGYSSCS